MVVILKDEFYGQVLLAICLLILCCGLTPEPSVSQTNTLISELSFQPVSSIGLYTLQTYFPIS